MLQCLHCGCPVLKHVFGSLITSNVGHISLNFIYFWRTALAWEIFGLIIGSLLALEWSGLLRSPIVLMLLCSISLQCSHVMSLVTMYLSGWLHSVSGGNNAFCLLRSSVAVSCTDPCEARPLRSGKLWLCFFCLTGLGSMCDSSRPGSEISTCLSCV